MARALVVKDLGITLTHSLTHPLTHLLCKSLADLLTDTLIHSALIRTLIFLSVAHSLFIHSHTHH